MPGSDRPAPADFLAIARSMSTRELEQSLGRMADKASHGDALAADMYQWTQAVIDERAPVENQLVLGADGHTYTQRAYREKQVSDTLTAGLGALEGNFVSFGLYRLTGDAHLAGMLGGFLNAAGKTAQGRNEFQRIDASGSEALTRPRGGMPPRDVHPSDHWSHSPPSTAPAGPPAPTDGSGANQVVDGLGPPPRGASPLSGAELRGLAQAILSVPAHVLDAAQALTAAGIEATAETGTFLEAFAAPATAVDPAPGIGGFVDQSANPGDSHATHAPDMAFNMEADAAQQAPDLDTGYDMRQDIQANTPTSQPVDAPDMAFNMEADAAQQAPDLDTGYDMRQDIQANTPTSQPVDAPDMAFNMEADAAQQAPDLDTGYDMRQDIQANTPTSQPVDAPDMAFNMEADAAQQAPDLDTGYDMRQDIQANTPTSQPVDAPDMATASEGSAGYDHNTDVGPVDAPANTGSVDSATDGSAPEELPAEAGPGG